MEDDDLDQELLDLMTTSSSTKKTTGKATASGSKSTAGSAAANSSKGKKPTRRKQQTKRKRGSDDEDSFSEQDNDSEDDFLDDDESMENSEDEDESDSDFDLSLDEEKLLAEIDESELRGLNELEREALLSEHAEKKQRLLEKLEIKKRLKMGAATGRRGIKQKRTKAKQASSKKLEELKARRSKGKKSRLSEILDDQEEGEMVGDINDFMESEDEEEYRKRIRSTYSVETEDKSSRNYEVTAAELNSIRVTRDQLEKWMYAPFFLDTVVGCFVRIGLGMGRNQQPTYRVAQIRDVTEYHRIYKVNGSQAKKALKVAHGKAEKEFLLDMVSNGDFTEREVQHWIQTMKSEKQKLPSKFLLKTRLEALVDANHHIFTNEEIDAMIAEKQNSLRITHKNLIREKVELMNEKEQLSQSDADTSRLARKLNEIDSLIGEKTSSASLDIWSKLNERNRRMNVSEGSQAERIARTEKSKVSKSNPFARIKAVSTHVFVTHNADSKDMDPTSPAATEPRTPGAPADLEVQDDTMEDPKGAVVDLFAGVDLDIEI